jgi:hypothetical protein
MHGWPFYVTHWAPQWRDELEERAAILEFDARLPRDEAESRAVAMVLARRNAAPEEER